MLFEVLKALTLTVVDVAVCLHYVWIMQLNGYFLSRSFKQIVFNKCTLPLFFLSILQITVIIFWTEVGFWVALFLGLIELIFQNLQPKKVKLVFTKRVVRWLICLMGVLFVANYFTIWFCLICCPIAVVLTNFLMLPLECLINLFYVNKAKNKLKKSKCTVIAVVGSYGKTSVKNILTHMLEGYFLTQCSPNSFNTVLGLTKFINGELKNDTQMLVLEFGAKKCGDIKKLCKAFCPKHAILTGVTSQHLDTFKSLQNVIKTKGEVLSFLNKDSVCVINGTDDNSKGYQTVGQSQKTVVGLDCDVWYENLKVFGTHTTFDLIEQHTWHCKTNLLGSVNVLNICLAYALARKFVDDKTKLIDSLQSLKFTPHRLELITLSDRYILDDSYNANILGVESCLQVLTAFSGQRFVITQGIVELGEIQYEKNLQFAKQLAHCCDYCFVLGQNEKAIKEGLSQENFLPNHLYSVYTVNEAVAIINGLIKPFDLIVFQNDLPDNFLRG